MTACGGSRSQRRRCSCVGSEHGSPASAESGRSSMVGRGVTVLVKVSRIYPRTSIPGHQGWTCWASCRPSLPGSFGVDSTPRFSPCLSMLCEYELSPSTPLSSLSLLVCGGCLPLFVSCFLNGSRLCRGAGEGDTRHLGMWSVGGREDIRLLLENMSSACVSSLLGPRGD